jgi:hypothetical protein
VVFNCLTCPLFFTVLFELAPDVANANPVDKVCG